MGVNGLPKLPGKFLGSVPVPKVLGVQTIHVHVGTSMVCTIDIGISMIQTSEVLIKATFKISSIC